MQLFCNVFFLCISLYDDYYVRVFVVNFGRFFDTFRCSGTSLKSVDWSTGCGLAFAASPQVSSPIQFISPTIMIQRHVCLLRMWNDTATRPCAHSRRARSSLSARRRGRIPRPARACHVKRDAAYAILFSSSTRRRVRFFDNTPQRWPLAGSYRGLLGSGDEDVEVNHGPDSEVEQKRAPGQWERFVQDLRRELWNGEREWDTWTAYL